MPGPEPSPNRRRRNVPVKIAERVYLPAEGRKGPAPKVRLPEDRHVTAMASEMWRAWWKSPQASQWHLPTAVYGLTRLLLMYEALWAGEMPVREQAEMRQLESQYGLNPRGMRELKWEIGEPEPAKPSAPPAADEVGARRASRRARVTEAAATST
jgi:hypothetical protein